jgi:sugar phosphate isomerase/epimerase
VIVPGRPDVHLTYCTNIHPGETWDEVRDNVRTHVRAVKARLAPQAAFGVGLRLSHQAARGLAAPGAVEAFRHELERLGLYVFTVNGFPYGAFHARPVKEGVYRPDWLEDERLEYSDTLASLLATLLPRGGSVEGTVSTVPGCFRGRAGGDAAAAMAGRLLRHTAHLWRIREDSGLTIGLALEPEPHCLLETTADAAAFFEEHLFGRGAVSAFTGLTGLSGAAAQEALHRHLGVCLDACHAAVEFEEPLEAVRRLQAAGIRILKIQVSAGLRLERPDREALGALERFAEPVYLHQVVARQGAGLHRYLDLPEAIHAARALPPEGVGEWRVHFHVPLFQETLGPFRTTQPFVAELLRIQARTPITDHLEVETYTWDVLPEEHRREHVVDAVARELAWTLDVLRHATP